MNVDQRANIEEMVDAIAVSLFTAWGYFHLLQGIHEGSKAHPVVVGRFDHWFEEAWRAIFEGLFAKAGTLLDRTKGTFSLPNLATMTLRYGDAEQKHTAKAVNARLQSKNGPLVKISSWRHLVVAHQTQDGLGDTFYSSHKMKLDEVSDALRELEELLNTLSLEVLERLNDTGSSNRALVQQGNELIASIAKQKRARTTKPSKASGPCSSV